MAKIVKMPVLGQSVEEVRIIQWLKNEGDAVQVGDNLAEIETDKVSTFFESSEAGILRKILAPVDSFLAVGAPAVILTDTADEPLEGETATVPAAPATPEAQASAPVASAASAITAATPRQDSDEHFAVSPRARRVADEKGVDIAELAGRGTGPKGRVQEKDVLTFLEEQEAAAKLSAEITERGVKASPLARAVADTDGVNLQDVSGTGTGGRIVASDVRATSAPTPAPASQLAPETSGKRTVTLTGLRKRVADNILRSVQRAPHVTLHLSADMGAAMELRKTLLPPIEKKTGIRLSPTDIIIKAVAVALAEHPYMNAHIEGDTITLFDAVHVGLAVSLGEEGLIVPVIKDADKKGLAEIAKNRDDLAKRARANGLTPTDMQGGTFSVSNLGSYGIEGFNPIIAPPQVGILGVGGIADAVVAKNGVPTVRPMMTLSLSFDHRAMDGAPAAAFLARLKEILETPTLLLV